RASSKHSRHTGSLASTKSIASFTAVYQPSRNTNDSAETRLKANHSFRLLLVKALGNFPGMTREANRTPRRKPWCFRKGMEGKGKERKGMGRKNARRQAPRRLPLSSRFP